MKKFILSYLLSAFACFIFFSSVNAQDTDRPWVYTDMTNQIEMHDTSSEIRSGDMILLSKISAISTTQSSYDVYAPFDGRIEEIHAELFDTVDQDTVLATVFTTELAAMMDSSPEASKSQTRRRWQDVFKPFYIKPEEKGIITKIHVTPNTKVYAGDRLFTVSRKVLLIGKNTEPIYNPLLEGMTADVEHFRTGNNFTAKLVRFIPIKDKPYYYRMWLEVLDIKKGMAIGEQYDGDLTVAKSIGTRMVDRKDIIRRNGKKYVLMEVETGLETETEIELIRPITNILNWHYVKDGNPLPEKKKTINPPSKTSSKKIQKQETAEMSDIGTPTVIMDEGLEDKKPAAAKKTTLKRKTAPASKPVLRKNTGKKAVPAKTKADLKRKSTALPMPAAGIKTRKSGVKAKTAKPTAAPAKKTPPSSAKTTAAEQEQEQISDDAKPMDVKIEGESDSKVYTSNEDVSSDFLEGED